MVYCVACHTRSPPLHNTHAHAQRRARLRHGLDLWAVASRRTLPTTTWGSTRIGAPRRRLRYMRCYYQLPRWRQCPVRTCCHLYQVWPCTGTPRRLCALGLDCPQQQRVSAVVHELLRTPGPLACFSSGRSISTRIGIHYYGGCGGAVVASWRWTPLFRTQRLESSNLFC